MSNLPMIDFVFIVLVFVLAVVAGMKGFVEELFDRGAPVIGVWMAVIFYKRLAAMLLPSIKIALLANILSFVLLFIVAFLLVKIIQQIIGSIFEAKILRQLDHTLGFAFGLVEGLAVVALILFILISQPWFAVQGLIGDSIFYRVFTGLLSNPSQFLPTGA